MRKRAESPISGKSAGEARQPASGGARHQEALGVTDCLDAWSAGDPGAADALIPLIYEELRELARAQMREERRGHTLRPTALVHEVYLRLLQAKRVRWESRAHFFGAVARLMRQVLVDHARHRQAVKRGGGATLLAMDEGLGVPAEQTVDLLALEAALSALGAMDARQARIVELRFFTGLTIPEVACLLGVGTATVEREWRTAKAWLLHELRRR